MEFQNFDQLAEINNIIIEIGTKLHLEIEGVSYPVVSVFVGMSFNEYVVIKIPTHINSIKEKLFSGNSIVVKYIFKGTVFAFQTDLIEMLTAPVRALILRYPKIVQNHELRGTKRNKCFIPTNLIVRKNKKKGVIKDINKSGCRCLLKIKQDERKFFQINDEIALSSKFPGIAKEQLIVGNIKNIRPVGRELDLGIEFKQTPDDIDSIIMTYILSIEEFI